ncbi:MAG: thioredoxin family protein, partial [Acidimicrobiales bacterium]
MPARFPPELPDGLVAVVKRDCATCRLVAPVLAQLVALDATVTVYSQDDPTFPEATGGALDDTDLELSWRLDLDTVPTLLRVESGAEVDRTVGWDRDRWEALTDVSDLGPDLPSFRPGCGSLSVDPERVDALAVRFGASVLRSRRVELASLEDDYEALFERGWTDGLPVVPPTEARVLRMLEGTTRSPEEVVAVVPPDLVE